MAISPDQFQRRVHVRLPIADRYLAGRDPQVKRDLAESFRRPLLTVRITPEPPPPEPGTPPRL